MSLDYSSLSNLSVEPSTTRHLNAAQKERLTFLLDRYLTALEEGVAPPVEALANDDPGLVEPLRSYIAGLDDLHQIAAGFVPQADDSESADESPGETNSRTLGDFRLLEEIGRGGMGVVYRAEQMSLGRIVAIKLLPFAAVLDSRQIVRFKNEAQAAAQLQHPHIVPVHTVGSVRGVHYYAMQFIDGVSMDQWILDQRETNCPNGWKRAVRWGVDVAEALHVAHESGVVHRDIKPSNLMLDLESKIWVTDFGLARCQTDATLTKSGDVVGTMKYMSPEQARGEAAIVDGRTDVYSLGATLYEMLCLQPAQSGSDAPAILRDIDQRTAPRLRTVRPELPRDLETVVAKAMSKTRDARYETAAEFAADLHRVLAGEPTIARPPTIVDRVSHWAMQHRNAVAGVVLVGVLTLVGFATSTAMIATAKRESDASTVRAEQSDKLSRGAVDRLGAQMAELLAEIPAAENVRRQLLQETLTYYQDFANQTSHDPELLEDLAITYGKIGSLQSEIGSNDDAVQSLRHSAELFGQLSAANSGDRSLAAKWATSQNNLALALEHRGDLDAAVDQYRSAIAIQQRLAESQPNDSTVHASLALSWNNYGLLLGKTGQVSESESALRRSAEIAESVTTENRSEELTQQLASTYQNLSGLITSQDPEQATHFARTALKNQMIELNKDRGNPKAASRVALTLNSLGAALSESGDLTAAIQSYRQAADIQQQLTQRWPGQQTYSLDLAVTQNNLGLGLAKLRKFEEARVAFDHALALQVPIEKLFPDDADLKSTLGGVYNNLAFVEERLSLPDEALKSYRLAVDFQRAAHESAADVHRYREFLSKHYFNYARLLRHRGRASEAAAIALQRRELWHGDGERLAAVAEELLLASSQIDDNSGMSAEGRQVISRADCVDHARETLRMAIDAGFRPPPDLLNRPEYYSLREAIPVDGT